MKRFVLTLLLLSFSLSFLTACNTIEGAGKDVKKVGEKVEDAAQNAKH